MLVKPLPKTWLIHDITYKAYSDERDDYGNDKFEDEVEINFVRYDDGSLFARSIQEDTIRYNGVIFVDLVNSTNLPSEFKEKSIIMYNGRELRINKVINCYHPQSKTIHHYELEVV